MTQEIFTEKFKVGDYISGSMAYKYGICARQLHYSAQTGTVTYDARARKAMDRGKWLHMMIESELIQKWPEWNLKAEQKAEKNLPQEIYGIKKVRVTPDLLGETVMIEIKPRYSLGAYYQTLIQRYALPIQKFMMYSYGKRELFPIKADAKMAAVYVGRILTALKFLPPRVPNAEKEKEPCRSCQFRERCWTEESGTWEQFKIQSEYAVHRMVGR